MSIKLAKCPRCKVLFAPGKGPVCSKCMTDEEHDYRRIAAVLRRRPGLKVQELAEEADVPVEVVLRMLHDGRIQQEDPFAPAMCGRCGAPAMDAARRLCAACLVELDRECRKAREKLAQQLRVKPSMPTRIRQTLRQKRRGA